MKVYTFTVWFQERNRTTDSQGVQVEIELATAIVLGNALGPEGARRVLARRAVTDVQGEQLQQRFSHIHRQNIHG